MWYLWTIGVIGFCLLLSFFMYLGAFFNPKKKDITFQKLPGKQNEEDYSRMIEMVKEVLALPYEPVETVSKDGLRLCGRYYEFVPGAPIHLEFNGYKGVNVRDNCGGVILAKSIGHNIILVNQRAHGNSEGHTISFGIKERFDVLSWVNYAVNRFGENTTVYLGGISMGAATVLMSTGLNLPSNVKGIWADCPYSSPWAIIRDVAKRRFPFAFILYPFLILGAFIFGHFDLFATTAEEAVGKTNIPIHLIHGSIDTFVPVEISRKLARDYPEVITYSEFEGATHGSSMLVNLERYKNEYIEFYTSTVQSF